jgi:hypothetical protein
MNQRVWVFGVVLWGLLGCAHQQTRLQCEDEADKEVKYEVKTIGDITSVDNADEIIVSGVGLVTGLEGTGGEAPPGDYRLLLEDHLRKQGVTNIKEILASKDNALVLVTAVIPAGAHKNDPLDIEVTLPPQSRATSLRGGVLQESILNNYDTAKNIFPDSKRADRLLKGHPLATAKGSVLVGFGDGDEADRLRQGRIWGGGRGKLDRPFALVLNSDQQFARIAQTVAERTNETFHGSFPSLSSALATAHDKKIVYLNVPPHYRHNLPRYLRVVRLIPLRETPESGSAYRRRLANDLLDPAHTITAALRLEALGESSVPALKQGLQSKHPLVRFSSAEALAYLNCTACGEELARLVEQQPVLRAFSLTALASLNEAVSYVELRRLLASPSAETRYGAFRALRALDEREPSLQGELLNDSFWLHRVAPNSPPLVHLSSSRRAEIVLFGQEPVLLPPFSVVTGDFVITANREDDKCTVSRFSVQRGVTHRQCSLQLEEVLRTLGELGGMYSDAVEFLRQAERSDCLSSRVAIDALPQATTVYQLAKAGTSDPDLLVTDEEILKAKADFGATPTLFEKTAGRRARSAVLQDEEAALRDRKAKSAPESAQRSGKSTD